MSRDAELSTRKVKTWLTVHKATQFVSAAGQINAICATCGNIMTVDAIHAGIEVPVCGA